MEKSGDQTMDDVKDDEFTSFASKRIIVGLLLSVVILWIAGTLLGFFDKPTAIHTVKTEREITVHTDGEIIEKPDYEDHTKKISAGEKVERVEQVEPVSEPAIAHVIEIEDPKRFTTPSPGVVEIPAVADHDWTEYRQTIQSQGDVSTKSMAYKPLNGVAFVTACIKPLAYELDERFWGWRPNDIINFTDNVNNFQLGILEVTRRTAVNLAERISRTGSTAAFDESLERAMSWFMVKADRYWFPSPESKYSDGLDELRTYMKKLEKGEANFYTRSDNLIPLLKAYENLLGSCDENLVKTKEDDGSPVSFSKVDDYFYYSKGVASAMETVLKAILEDFQSTLEARHGIEILHHAIRSCHHAIEINPWVITNCSLSSIFANHRANMAAPISHARFYIGVLIKTLST